MTIDISFVEMDLSYVASVQVSFVEFDANSDFRTYIPIDLSSKGWTSNVPGPLYSTLDEAIPDDGDYIISPLLFGTSCPYIYRLPSNIIYSNLSIKFRSKYSTYPCQVRVRVLNEAEEDLGGSDWVTPSDSFTQFEIVVSITDTATKLKVEARSI